jgi:hypothetical protein
MDPRIAEQNMKTYGVKYLDEFVAGIEESLSYKMAGGFMVVAGMMSDAQEQMAFGDVEGARQTLNLAKYLQFKIAAGQLNFKNVEVV